MEFLCHRISAKGIQPTLEKVEAIRKAPEPSNVTQLKSFLGAVNYYGKFLPDLSSVLAPLYKLLQKDVKWSGEATQKTSFEEVKSRLTSDSVLVHYDPAIELVLACDASPYGVGAVLSHRFSPYYLTTRPLQHIFKETSAIPPLASVRIQRWALLLGGYDYRISYKPGPQHANADMLSRLLSSTPPTTTPDTPETVFLLDVFDSSPVTSSHIRQWTAKDLTLIKSSGCSSDWEYPGRS